MRAELHLRANKIDDCLTHLFLLQLIDDGSHS